MKRDASWVVVSKETGLAVLETYSKKIRDAINTEKYEIWTIMDYLVELNRRIKEGQLDGKIRG